MISLTLIALYPKTGVALTKMSTEMGTNTSVFHRFACCVACSPLISVSIPFINYWTYALAFSVDGYQLSCDPSSYGLMVPRNNDNWCSRDQDYTMSGLKSLLKCPNAPAYTGLTKQPRFVGAGGNISIVTATVKSCGSLNCNNRGSCSSSSSPIVCTCDSGFWGSSCQFSMSDGPTSSGQPDRDSEYTVLQDLFLYTDGFRWHRVGNWLGVGADPCTYPGITCK
jgi:hypothetical protein